MMMTKAMRHFHWQGGTSQERKKNLQQIKKQKKHKSKSKNKQKKSPQEKRRETRRYGDCATTA